MGTTYKLLQTAIITCSQTVGENSLGFYRPRHHYQIFQEFLYQHWLRWHKNDVLMAEQYDKYNADYDDESDEMYHDMITHQQMFSEKREDEEFLGFD